ncbi:MAG TPA: hypothetical protein VKJ00_08270 [Thermoanaerobaculia bacterium]|nr:hypothetical protein [Thermoanaerobaculia bacterium]
MTWLRRILSVPLIIVALVCAIGTVKIFAGNLPDSSVGEGVVTAVFAVALGAGACFLLRPEIRRLRAMSFAQLRDWLLANPLAQAAVLWLAAAPFMAAAPKAALVPGLVAQCAYTVLSTRAAGRARRFWPTALLALLGFVLLMGCLAGLAEALAPRGFGEAGMVFLLPMYGLLILLPVFGIARWFRKSKTPSPQSPAP